MLVRYNTDKLKQLINDFAELTSLDIDILDPDLNVILRSEPAPQEAFCLRIQQHPEGEHLCACSDNALLARCTESKEVAFHTCHAGLHDTVLPIIKDDIFLGYIMLGRIRMTESTENMRKNLSWMGDELDEMCRLYYTLPFYTEKKFKSLQNLAVALATYIITYNLIRIDFLTDVNNVVSYIEENLNSDLSVKHLCEAMHISKNTLYKNFRAAMNCTLNEYVASRRIELAKQLLSTSQMTLTEISKAIGLNNPTYFPKLFKKHTGMTPSQYRASAG